MLSEGDDALSLGGGPVGDGESGVAGQSADNSGPDATQMQMVADAHAAAAAAGLAHGGQFGLGGIDMSGNSSNGAGAQQMYAGHPGSVDPYMYLNNLGMPLGNPNLSAHAAYMSLPNNIVPNVNFLGGGPTSGANAAQGPPGVFQHHGQAGAGLGGPHAHAMGLMNGQGLPYGSHMVGVQGLDGQGLMGLGGVGVTGGLMPHSNQNGGRRGRNNQNNQNGGGAIGADGMQLNGNGGNASGPNNSICKFFAAGHCARGDQCNYTHMANGVKVGGGNPMLMPGMPRGPRGGNQARDMYGMPIRAPRGPRGGNNLNGGVLTAQGMMMQNGGGGGGGRNNRNGPRMPGVGVGPGGFMYMPPGPRGPRMSHAQQAQQAAQQHAQHMSNLSAMQQAYGDPGSMMMGGMGGMPTAGTEGPNGMLGLGAPGAEKGAGFDPTTGAPTGTLLSALGGSNPPGIGGPVAGDVMNGGGLTSAGPGAGMHNMFLQGPPGVGHPLHHPMGMHPHHAMGLHQQMGMMMQGLDGVGVGVGMHDQRGMGLDALGYDINQTGGGLDGTGVQQQQQQQLLNHHQHLQHHALTQHAHHGGHHNQQHGHHNPRHHSNNHGNHHGNNTHDNHHGHHGGNQRHRGGNNHANNPNYHANHGTGSNAAAGVGGADAASTPLSEFLSKFTANSSPEELTGHIYLVAKDQYGCRLLQRMLDENKPLVVDMTFNECFEHMNELMTDPFGNYLCQKLIEHSSEEQRFQIIAKVAPDLVAISLNMHGTRAVQKLVESIRTPAEVDLVVGALRSSVVTLIKDLNGNHVIQRCLHHLNSKDNQFIYDAVSRCCVSVATHKHGCCVLQRTIDYATIPQKRQLVQEIVANSLELVQDAFGNYVVQYILDLGESTIAHGVMQNLLGNISSLSVQKFSSNVVEKVLELANEKMKAKLIEELINPERLPRLLQDPYANYVIQKALAVSKKAQFERLVSVIKPHLLALRNTSFGKRIQSKILKKFPDLNLGSLEMALSSEEINPQLMGAMVSGMSGMGGGNGAAAAGANGEAAATTQGGAAAGARGKDATGAPGGMSIQSPLGGNGASLLGSPSLLGTGQEPLLGSYLGAAQSQQHAAAAAAAAAAQQQQQGEEEADDQDAPNETVGSSEAGTTETQ